MAAFLLVQTAKQSSAPSSLKPVLLLPALPRRWLSDQFTAKGSGFMQASVSFLDGKLRSEQPALQVRLATCSLPSSAGVDA